MLPALKRIDARSRWNFSLLILFLAIALLLGGASRSDVVTQPLVRLAAIALIAVSAVQMRANEWRQIRTPAIFLLAISVIIAVQLIPLPPSLWAQLPGRALYAEVLQNAGIEPGWRPLSLTPDLTLNALLSILPPLAVIMALGIVDRSLHRLLAPAIIIGLIMSCLIGVLQIAGDGFYFYSITNGGSAVGLFANRNHQALFVSAAFPVLAAWAELPHDDPNYQRLRMWLARCISAALFPILLITGSRAGLALGVLGAVLAIAMVEFRRGRHKRSTPLLSLLLLRAVPLGLGMIAVGITIFLAKGEALHRLMGADQADTRVVLLPTFAKMAGAFLPWGSGYGSFDSVFRAYEPDWFLSPSYLNQAHNDLAQILIEGGVFPMILLTVFLGWFLVQSWKLWTGRTLRPEQLLGRAGSAAVILILLASLVDYPLRTPVIAVLMALMCMWMLSAGNPAPASQDEGDGLGSREGVG